MVEEERNKKQAFLMTEIIEKQYDPDEFMSYCESLKGSDIDLWTLPELENCVKDFQKSKKTSDLANPSTDPQGPPPESVAPAEATKPDSKPQEPETEEKKQDAEIKESPKEDKFLISCKCPEATSLSKQPLITFEISDAVQVKGGFFSSDFYVFPVKTTPLNWEVSRRFSEFVWLREILSLSLPGNFIPPIPARQNRQGTMENHLLKRKKILIKFTSGLARNNFLLSFDVVEKFFSIRDQREYEDFKKRTKKIVKKPDTADQFYSKTGSTQGDVTFPGQRPEKLYDYASSSENIEKKLKKYSVNVINDLKAVQAEYLGMSDLFKQLEDIQTMIPKREGLLGVYQSLKECMKDLAGQSDCRSISFEEYFSLYFKYTHLEKIVMKEMLKDRESAHSEYVSAESKKKNVEKTRNIHAFLNITSLEEVERVVSENSALMQKHFLDFAENEVKSTTELHGLWSKFIGNIDAI